MEVGVAIKPGTSAESVCAFVEKGLVDMVLVMTVEPASGDKSLIPSARKRRRRFAPSFRI